MCQPFSCQLQSRSIAWSIPALCVCVCWHAPANTCEHVLTLNQPIQSKPAHHSRTNTRTCQSHLHNQSHISVMCASLTACVELRLRRLARCLHAWVGPWCMCTVRRVRRRCWGHVCRTARTARCQPHSCGTSDMAHMSQLTLPHLLSHCPSVLAAGRAVVR